MLFGIIFVGSILLLNSCQQNVKPSVYTCDNVPTVDGKIIQTENPLFCEILEQKLINAKQRSTGAYCDNYHGILSGKFPEGEGVVCTQKCINNMELPDECTISIERLKETDLGTQIFKG